MAKLIGFRKLKKEKTLILSKKAKKNQWTVENKSKILKESGWCKIKEIFKNNFIIICIKGR